MTTPLHTLLTTAARGDPEARDVLLREIYPTVCAHVHQSLARDFRRRHPWMMAMFSTGDIVQDVFLAVVKAGPDLGVQDEQHLRRWLAVQVENRIIDRVRFHQAQRRDVRQVEPLQRADESVAVPAPGASPSGCAVLDERALLLRRALSELDAGDLDLWRLRVDEEQSFTAIAATLRLASDEAARSAFRRVQARLALRLQKLGLVGDAALEP